jgi:predicted ester cyclase
MTYKTFHGTQEGPFMGIPATGKEVAFDNIDILTVTDGKITEHWAVGDMLSLMQQLGVVPLPE